MYRAMQTLSIEMRNKRRVEGDVCFRLSSNANPRNWQDTPVGAQISFSAPCARVVNVVFLCHLVVRRYIVVVVVVYFFRNILVIVIVVVVVVIVVRVVVHVGGIRLGWGQPEPPGNDDEARIRHLAMPCEGLEHRLLGLGGGGTNKTREVHKRIIYGKRVEGGKG